MRIDKQSPDIARGVHVNSWSEKALAVQTSSPGGRLPVAGVGQGRGHTHAHAGGHAAAGGGAGGRPRWQGGPWTGGGAWDWHPLAGAGLGPPGGHVVEGPVVSGEAGAGLGPPGGHVVEGPVVSGEAGAGLGPPGGQRRRGLSLAQELAQVWASRLLSGRDEEWLGRGDERASSPLASSLALR